MIVVKAGNDIDVSAANVVGAKLPLTVAKAGNDIDVSAVNVEGANVPITVVNCGKDKVVNNGEWLYHPFKIPRWCPKFLEIDKFLEFYDCYCKQQEEYIDEEYPYCIKRKEE